MDELQNAPETLTQQSNTEKNQILWIAGSIITLLLVFGFFIYKALNAPSAPALTDSTHVDKDNERVARPRSELPALGGQERRIGEEDPLAEISSSTESTPLAIPDSLTRKPVLPQQPSALAENAELEKIDQSPIKVEGVSLKNDNEQ